MQFHETVFLAGGQLPGGGPGTQRRSPPAGARGAGGRSVPQRRGVRLHLRPHRPLLHMQNPRVKAWLLPLLGKTLNTCERDSWVYSSGRYTRYPFQSHFFGLPRRWPPSAWRACSRRTTGAGASARPVVLRLGASRLRRGRGPALHVPLQPQAVDRAAGAADHRVAGPVRATPDLREVVLGALFDRAPQEGYNARFFYPGAAASSAWWRRWPGGRSASSPGSEWKASI